MHKKIPHTAQKPITTMQDQLLLRHGSFGGDMLPVFHLKYSRWASN